MASPPRLTICTYLNRWDPDAGQLYVSLLVIPVGDPGQPLTAGWPGVTASVPFAGAKLEFAAHIGTNPAVPPTIADISAGPSFSVTPPSEQGEIFDFFRANYDVTAPQPAISRSGSATLLKYLPDRKSTRLNSSHVD